MLTSSLIAGTSVARDATILFKNGVTYNILTPHPFSVLRKCYYQRAGELDVRC